MPADMTPLDLPSEAEHPAPEAELPAPAGLDGQPRGRSPRLAVLFLVLLGALGLLGVTGTAVSAVDALLANPAQGCGGG